MKQLIRLKDVELYKVDSVQSSDGDFIKTSSFIKSYKTEVQEIRDDLSISVYGAEINKMIRVASIRQELEKYLKPKLNNTNDNISKYQIKYDGTDYKIVDLTSRYIDCKRL